MADRLAPPCDAAWIHTHIHGAETLSTDSEDQAAPANRIDAGSGRSALRTARSCRGARRAALLMAAPASAVAGATLCRWALETAEILRPLVDLMKSEVLASRVIHTDDTPMPVQDKNLTKTRTARLWVYCGDWRHRYTVYDYTTSRKRDGPVEFLGGYRRLPAGRRLWRLRRDLCCTAKVTTGALLGACAAEVL